MAAKIIDGKAIGERVLQEVRAEIVHEGLRPKLAVVLVGKDEASKVYVSRKEVAADRIGIQTVDHKLDERVGEGELLALIDKLNKDESVHGILVQQPFPKQINARRVMDAVMLEKDVDGFNSASVGKLFVGQRIPMPPCTPAGVLELLDRSGVHLEGKHVVIVGRSNIVGTPLAALMLKRNATVTVCHSKTKKLGEITKQADVLVAAAGRPKLTKAGMVGKGAVVVDVGMNRVGGKLVGDVDFDAVRKKAGMITPVPGGVGPMTVAMLMRNVMQACRIATQG